ncbi:Aspartate transaminase [Lentibacillus sp. JNUCC-1]|uniref:pyridoxal phosphate-dependent aminotransferase n=1 Tax=Lentibacillus sp. JNUCC-1 TaxID=2654513 RepID=UPI0012E79C02|nr:pyridoxal phosphate-dependent aminotransferase [Lentibacillus sp. JNUCC-1]MUV39799.1 Aspartate transaminase [Lentibacillus sp. JNUCC-1]
MNLAKRIQTLSPSPTLAITAKAQELKQAGHDVIGLGVGEPDFNTPEFIIQAAKQAMDDGHTKYTPAGGILELKKAIAAKLAKDNSLTYDPDQIIVTSGAKYALYNLFQVLLSPGDEVIVPAPYWVSYPEQVKLANGEPVIVKGEEANDFKITPEQLKAAITNQTKALILNSPSNPTGMMYNADELAQLGEICLQNNLMIISDEIYEELIYTTDVHVSIAQISPELKESTIIINGVSKSHAMTGWRIGFAAGPKKIIKAMTSLASHATSNPASISQYAALAAYEGGEEEIEEMRSQFSARLDMLYDMIMDVPGMACRKPKGAFYLFPNVEETVRMTGYSSVDEWVKALLEEQRVALVPGSGFGSPENVRLSYATSMEILEEAAKRIKQFVLDHQK